VHLCEKLFSDIFWPLVFIDDFGDEDSIHETDETFESVLSQILDQNFLFDIHGRYVVRTEVQHKDDISFVV